GWERGSRAQAATPPQPRGGLADALGHLRSRPSRVPDALRLSGLRIPPAARSSRQIPQPMETPIEIPNHQSRITNHESRITNPVPGDAAPAPRPRAREPGLKDARAATQVRQ